MADFTLQLLHASDQEAGVAALDDAPRFSAVLNALKDDFANTVILSSGDAYLPSPFFFAGGDPSLAPIIGAAGQGRADIAIQNKLGFQAIAFGNHEFDLGTSVIESLIQPSGNYPGALFPYLSANLDFSKDGALNDRIVADGLEASTIPGRIAKSTVITVNGEKIGVVGATTPTLPSISSPGPGVVTSPSNSNDFDALAAIIQQSIDQLTAQGIDKVIGLFHMQQIAIERDELAPRLKDIDIIMAGGSNTRLVDENDRLRPGDTAQGEYPTFVTGADGNPIALINTDGNYKYVGRLVLDFDANGVIIPESYDSVISGAFATDEAGVDFVYGADVNVRDVADPEILAITDALREVIQDQEGNIFGETEVFLNGTRSDVRTQETNLGNLTADANLAIAKKSDPSVVISIKNGGGIRDNIGVRVTQSGSTDPNDFVALPPQQVVVDGVVIKEEGEISQLDIANSLRFNNDLSLVTVTAAELLRLIEHGVSQSTPGATPGRFPQVSGVSFSFDPDLPANQRVQSLAVVYEAGNLIDAVVIEGKLIGDSSRTFRVVTLGFLANGGDSYPFPTFSNLERVNLFDPNAPKTGVATFAGDGTEQDALAEYLAAEFSTEPFAKEDVGPAEDLRIQNLNFRNDDVFRDAINGTDQGETLIGTPDADLILARGGNDQVFAKAGDDTVFGGAGNDEIQGDVGNDLLYGGDGNDTLNGGSGDDEIYGEAGNDVIFGGSGFNLIDAGEGNNTVYGGAGEDFIDAGAGDDVIYTGGGYDFVRAGDGNNKIFGDSDIDEIFTGSGNDTIYGNGGLDNIVSGAGDDLIYGGSQADTITAGLGNDTIYGNGGMDVLNGGAGDDLIYGGSQADTISGGAGNDTIFGNGGADFIDSGSGDDFISLGRGQATIVLAAGEGFDTIENFRSSQTKFQLDGVSFDDLSFTGRRGDTEIAFGDDVLALVKWTSVSTFTNNPGIFI